jgi:hypothetical protein
LHALEFSRIPSRALGREKLATTKNAKATGQSDPFKIFSKKVKKGLSAF